jgi:Flp pilus assembly protein TadD
VLNALDAGEGDVRIRLLRERLAANPNDLEARLQLAAEYKKAGFPDIALEHLRLASARFPDSQTVAIQLARALVESGSSADGRTHLESFAAEHEASSEIWSWLGILQDRAGDYPSGERSHRAAIEREPRSDALYNNLGYNLLLQSRNDEAAIEFRRALELAPRSTVARNNLGIALASQPDQAMEVWKGAADRATAHNNLGAILLEKGDHVAARREFERALEYNRDHYAALNNLRLLSDLDGRRVDLPYLLTGRPVWRRVLRGMAIVLGAPSGKSNEGAVVEDVPAGRVAAGGTGQEGGGK